MKFFPILTPVPFILDITTFSPMRREDVPPAGTVFPSPPQTPSNGIDFQLVRTTFLKAQDVECAGHHVFVEDLSVFGRHSSDRTTTVQGISELYTRVAEGTWIPAYTGSEIGSWKQQASFKSTFVLQCTPSFYCRIMSLQVRNMFYYSHFG